MPLIEMTSGFTLTHAPAGSAERLGESLADALDDVLGHLESARAVLKAWESHPDEPDTCEVGAHMDRAAHALEAARAAYPQPKLTRVD